MSRLPRRAFLKIAAVSGAALAAGCSAPSAPTEPPATPAPAQPTAGPRTSLQPAPTEILITPVGELYGQTYGDIPEVDAAAFKLTIDGLVENPLTLSLDEIKALPAVEEMLTLECIGNPVGGNLIGNCLWKGCDLAPLLDRVGVKPEAVQARFSAADDYVTSVDLSWLTQPGVRLIYEINGEPLTPDHGAPLRIRMPGLYGQKQPKWLTRIEFIAEEVRGYWESQGWSQTAAVKTNSQFFQPRQLSGLAAGEVPVFGVAYAGQREIVAVEVQVDEGDWQPAELLHGPTPKVWTQWSFAWPAEAGRHTLRVRATDDAGTTQLMEASSLLGGAFPSGTDEIHKIIVPVA
jgi:DMSO/TMAO reductase YedYZ molybdopterin-dependent catalytic subunit